jgi:hydrogenase maturation protease
MQEVCGVIGIGNPLRRDDGIGLVLLDHLRSREKGFASLVTYIDGGTAGMNLLHYFSIYRMILLIDAVRFGGIPGQWRFFSHNEAISKSTQEHVSTHISDVFQVIRIAQKIGQIPQHLYIFGVEPEDVSVGQGLSDTLQNNLPVLKKSVEEKLGWMIETVL